MNINNSINVRL